jgi:hypothetical protein
VCTCSPACEQRLMTTVATCDVLSVKCVCVFVCCACGVCLCVVRVCVCVVCLCLRTRRLIQSSSDRALRLTATHSVATAAHADT